MKHLRLPVPPTDKSEHINLGWVCKKHKTANIYWDFIGIIAIRPKPQRSTCQPSCGLYFLLTLESLRIAKKFNMFVEKKTFSRTRYNRD